MLPFGGMVEFRPLSHQGNAVLQPGRLKTAALAGAASGLNLTYILPAFLYKLSFKEIATPLKN